MNFRRGDFPRYYGFSEIADVNVYGVKKKKSVSADCLESVSGVKNRRKVHKEKGENAP